MNDTAGNSTHSADHMAVSAFAAHCAHDLNNLLTGILGNLELMQNRAKRTGNTNFDGFLEGARSAAGRAADFAQRLLILSGRNIGDPAAVPVNQLAGDIVELMREQSVFIQADLAANAGVVFCDPSQFELALLELLANARDATSKSGAISLRTEAAGGQVTITVTDTGSGMTPEQFTRATQPFFSTRPNGPGKGLGLAIVKNFCLHAGGTLLLNNPGIGTEARLILPQAATDGWTP